MPTLNWLGKDKVVSHHTQVPFRILERRYHFEAATPHSKLQPPGCNKIVHGDNLEVLKALLPEYEGRVDCIYIDPPYNTGNEGWVYNDNVSDPQLRRWLGEVVGPEGEDLTRHDKWLCMMYPRLALMRQLLSENGVIFVSIDDNERENLRLIMDELFGRICFVTDISWQRTYSQRNDAVGVGIETENILVYSRQPNWHPNDLERTEEMDAKYGNPDNDPLGNWQNTSANAPGAATHQGMVYAIQHPMTGDMLYPPVGRCWTFGQQDILSIMQEWCEYELQDIDDAQRRAEICNTTKDDVRSDVRAVVLKNPLETSRQQARAIYDRGQWPKLFFTKGGLGGIRRKTYLTKVEGRKVTNLWKQEEVGTTDTAKKEQKRIFGGVTPFDTPKPSTLVQRIVEIATNEYSTVLDCFAGSGTTAHAVLLQNHKDHGHRRFVLVENMDYAERITAERVRRVMEGYPYEGKAEEDIFCRKLTAKSLLQGQRLLAETEAAAKAAEGEYDKISKPKIADGCLKVVGTKVYRGRMEGLGGSFGYYELGPRLFLDDGNLNEAVGMDALRAYIYYSETRQHLSRPQDGADPYLLDTFAHAAYYFYYDPCAPTTLDRRTLPRVVRTPADQYVVYADTCLLDEAFMAAQHIRFKKIPRDIKKI